MKKNILLFFVLSLIGLAISFFILNSNLQASDTGEMLVKLGKSLFYGMGALAVVFLFLLFIPSAFPSWKKFAVWFIPLATLLFIFYPEPSGADMFSPYPEQVFQWVSALYVVLSLGIIFINKIKK